MISEYDGSVKLTDDDYERLLRFRLGIRRFLHWSEQQAEQAGLTPTQHQLLLVIRGSGEPHGPTIGRISEALMLRHHSAVELVDRAELAGLVTRARDRDDGRVVRVTPTRKGSRLLEQLTIGHLDELRHLAPALEALLSAVAEQPS
jgi:DNA-binding MarR family transcriptional regulator